jgi:hypothetical protein
LKFVIVSQPKHGQFMMKREWDPQPWPMTYDEIYQLEIFRGHLYYRHDGSDNLVDSFQFKFIDHYGLG